MEFGQEETTSPPTSGAASPTAAPPAASQAAPVTGATAQAAPVPSTPAPAPTASTGTQTATAEAQPHQNIGNKMLHGILAALGGTEDVSYSRDPQTGRLIVSKTKSGAGTQFKRIIAGALVGAAAGANIKPGPGNKLRAGSAGFEAGEKLATGIDQQKMETADKDFDAEQKQLVNKATVAHLNQQIAESSWRMTREKADFAMSNADIENRYAEQIAQNPNNQDLGTYASFADFLNKHGDNSKQIAEMNANGLLRAVPSFDKEGKLAGVHIYKIDPVWATQTNSAPVKVDFGPSMTKEGKFEHNVQTIPAGGATNGQILTYQQSGQKAWLDIFQQDQENKRNAARIQGEKDTAAIRGEYELKAQQQKFSRADVLAHDKAYVQPANDTEYSYQKFMTAYNEHSAAKKAGKELPTGAQSMVALSQHIANTFGGKGSNTRVTKDLIEKHMGARSVSDAAEVAVNKLRNGDVLSDQQWEAFKDMLSDARKIRWEIAAKEANRKGTIPLNFLPSDLQSLGESKPDELPDDAKKQLKEGVHTTFGNGQTWTLQNGSPTRIN